MRLVRSPDVKSVWLSAADILAPRIDINQYAGLLYLGTWPRQGQETGPASPCRTQAADSGREYRLAPSSLAYEGKKGAGFFEPVRAKSYPGVDRRLAGTLSSRARGGNSP